jgi:uncharacterized protein YecE (DUF72 family)|uniref:DUF72 domain-containing protein n=1 Tax=candidate division WOR-3 bacterium TaxID=2052148 RepID=A0A7V3RI20_UNCW3
MELFVGTSGWYYDWNEELSLEWYIKNSNLNAIELNASFYRFPFPNQIKSWANKGAQLHWAVKVNRLITHQYKFSENGLKIWERFYKLFLPLEPSIDYYLFQLPPNMGIKMINKISRFIDKIKINKKFALEFRNSTWFNDQIIKWAESIGITIVSIDAPDLPRTIFNTSRNVYLRMHGREMWYAHNYTNSELKEIAERLILCRPDRIYVFFNNNHNMLRNAQKMMEILKDKVKK